MKDVALVYMSKYGHTKQYADWIKDDLGIHVVPITSFNAAQMLSYKLVIFASGVYSDKIQIMDFIKKNGSAINSSRMMIAAVTWYTNGSEEAKKKLIDVNYPDNFKNIVPMVVLNSGIDKKAISVMEKAQLTAASLAISKHEDRSNDDINALAIIKGYSDQTSKDNIKYLKEAIEEFLNPKKAEVPAPAPRASAMQMSAPVPPPKPQPVPEPPKPAPQELKPQEPQPAEQPKAPVPEPVKARVPDAAPVQPQPQETPAPSPYGMELKGDPSPEEATLSSVEAAFKNLRNTTVKEEAPAQQTKSSPVVSSLDDALAALNSGNMFANAAPAKYSASVEPQQPKPEPKKVVLPTADEIRPEQVNTLFVEAGTADTSVLPENYDDVRPAVDSTLFVEAGTADTSVLPEKYDDVRPAVDSTLFVEAGSADTSVLPEKYDDVRPPANNSFIPIEVPVIDGPDDYDYAVVDENEDDAVLSVSSEIDEINKAIEEAQTAAASAPAPVLHRPEPVKRPEPAAPKKNSYLEYFSKKNKEAEAAKTVPQEAPAPAAAAPEQPAKPVFERPKAAQVSDSDLFDPFADNAFDTPVSPAPVPTPPPAPTPAPVNTSMDDFDFDILGNESSTATGVSARALNAVNALAKAKAEEEAEKAKKAKEAEAAAAAANASNTYDVISNSLTSNIPEEPAYRQPEPQQPVHNVINSSDELAKLREEAEAVEKALMGMTTEEVEKSVAPAVSEYGTSEFIADPVAFEEPVVEEESDFIFSNDINYSLNNQTVVEPTAEERDTRSAGKFDFKKLQQEIEDSIEVNKRIKEKDAQRRIRDRDRDRILTEEEKNAPPVKRLSEPLDPDLFFQRPGKDYYASDSMPEIRFDRSKRN
ncbi:MAG: hypothetical protein IJ007_00535 [Oscillospiraceae bacterium]|nr:hypothetical protein [Oscillospiraceae bacterium]